MTSKSIVSALSLKTRVSTPIPKSSPPGPRYRSIKAVLAPSDSVQSSQLKLPTLVESETTAEPKRTRSLPSQISKQDKRLPQLSVAALSFSSEVSDASLAQAEHLQRKQRSKQLKTFTSSSRAPALKGEEQKKE